jgi:AraC family transcriptional regulator, regulatory protein of adaptative response / methylated-DNA-[protein]-cysteine methyltransferase
MISMLEMPTTRRTPRTAAPASADEPRWDAVVARDRAADGTFVFAVRTTGVYCRPSCPARRARRENVRFFGTPDEAERAGFRACLRCSPKATRALPGGAQANVVARAVAYLEAAGDRTVALAELARAVGMSASHLQRAFTRHVGVSPRGWQQARRVEAFKAQLKAGSTVSRATFEAGYGSSRGVYEGAAAALGMTPAAYARGGEGATIAWTTRATPVGLALVAATGRGICAVSLGDDVAALETELRGEFPRATLVRQDDDAHLARLADAVADVLAGRGDATALPVELRGTPFQVAVWNALRAIPRGETRSYAELAAELGRPGAARAVARACATNRVAVVVPCHRVVRGSGELSGYRWGVERKRSLLDGEKPR